MTFASKKVMRMDHFKLLQNNLEYRKVIPQAGLANYSKLDEILLVELDMSRSQMLGKVESGGGPIFKVVLEC